MMQKKSKSQMKIIAAFVAPVIVALLCTPVFADCETGILPDTWCDADDGIKNMIIDLIWVMSALVFVLGGVFLTICGVTWMTATDDAGKVATAKKRILEIVIGMVVFLLIDVIIGFLGI